MSMRNRREGDVFSFVVLRWFFLLVLWTLQVGAFQRLAASRSGQARQHGVESWKESARKQLKCGRGVEDGCDSVIEVFVRIGEDELKERLGSELTDVAVNEIMSHLWAIFGRQFRDLRTDPRSGALLPGRRTGVDMDLALKLIVRKIAERDGETVLQRRIENWKLDLESCYHHIFGFDEGPDQTIFVESEQLALVPTCIRHTSRGARAGAWKWSQALLKGLGDDQSHIVSHRGKLLRYCRLMHVMYSPTGESDIDYTSNTDAAPRRKARASRNTAIAQNADLLRDSDVQDRLGEAVHRCAMPGGEEPDLSPSISFFKLVVKLSDADDPVLISPALPVSSTHNMGTVQRVAGAAMDAYVEKYWKDKNGSKIPFGFVASGVRVSIGGSAPASESLPTPLLFADRKASLLEGVRPLNAPDRVLYSLTPGPYFRKSRRFIQMELFDEDAGEVSGGASTAGAGPPQPPPGGPSGGSPGGGNSDGNTSGSPPYHPHGGQFGGGGASGGSSPPYNPGGGGFFGGHRSPPAGGNTKSTGLSFFGLLRSDSPTSPGEDGQDVQPIRFLGTWWSRDLGVHTAIEKGAFKSRITAEIAKLPNDAFSHPMITLPVMFEGTAGLQTLLLVRDSEYSFLTGVVALAGPTEDELASRSAHEQKLQPQCEVSNYLLQKVFAYARREFEISGHTPDEVMEDGDLKTERRLVGPGLRFMGDRFELTIKSLLQENQVACRQVQIRCEFAGASAWGFVRDNLTRQVTGASHETLPQESGEELLNDDAQETSSRAAPATFATDEAGRARTIAPCRAAPAQQHDIGGQRVRGRLPARAKTPPPSLVLAGDPSKREKAQLEK
ncbi:unnamed protein product, partial [Amoebophrya sp. A120]|eukprot:GSA120T00001194001.1